MQPCLAVEQAAEQASDMAAHNFNTLCCSASLCSGFLVSAIAVARCTFTHSVLRTTCGGPRCPRSIPWRPSPPGARRALLALQRSKLRDRADASLTKQAVTLCALPSNPSNPTHPLLPHTRLAKVSKVYPLVTKSPWSQASPVGTAAQHERADTT